MSKHAMIIPRQVMEKINAHEPLTDEDVEAVDRATVGHVMNPEERARFVEVASTEIERLNREIRKDTDQLNDLKLKVAFVVPFGFAKGTVTMGQALAAIQEMVKRKKAEGKPPEDAALEIIHEHYQGMDEKYWPFLQRIKQHYVTLLSRDAGGI